MERTFWCPPQRLSVRRIDSDSSLKLFRAINRGEHALGKIFRRDPPGIQSRDDLAGYGFLDGDERIIAGRGPSVFAHLLGELRNRRHHGIGVGKDFVLQAQRVELPQEIGPSRVYESADDRLQGSTI